MRRAALAVIGLVYLATIFAQLFGLLPGSQQCTVGDSGLGAMQCRILLHGFWALVIGAVLMVGLILVSERRDPRTSADLERFAAIGGFLLYVLTAFAWYIAYLGL